MLFSHKLLIENENFCATIDESTFEIELPKKKELIVFAEFD